MLEGCLFAAAIITGFESWDCTELGVLAGDTFFYGGNLASKVSMFSFRSYVIMTDQLNHDEDTPCLVWRPQFDAVVSGISKLKSDVVGADQMDFCVTEVGWPTGKPSARGRRG